ncbi:MAG: hypothetical protein IKY35_01110 [Muribaculaceae bacterium]|nr:hypothetical protein [Muribaculaceae bacterium]
MIDITNLTSLITAFRQETEQGSISPETLGALLQAIANELKDASNDTDLSKLSSLYDNIKTMGNCLTNVVQGSADNNNVLADYTFFNPSTGMQSAQRSQVLIKQATTERAGAMRAQQVIDLNEAKKNIFNLQEAVSNIESNNASNNTRFDEIDQLLLELSGYVEQVDSLAQGNADSIGNIDENYRTLNSRVSYLPIHRGNIIIDSTSITSPTSNYFKYNMPDGHYDIVRGSQLIGKAISYMFGYYRVFEVFGLCYINGNSFVYHDRLDHVLVRVNSSGQIFVTGSIEAIDLQNQINNKQNVLTAGTGIDIKDNVISVDFVPETSYMLEFSASDGVISGSFDETTYNELRQAIEAGKTIVVVGGVTRTTAVSTALADDYLMIRYCVPRIQNDNASVTLSVYELKVSASSYTSKSIHKILPAAS